MGELLMAQSAWTLIAKQKIMPNDVILLRQDAFPCGVQTPNHVATLVALETACDEKCPQWDSFFIRSITHYMIHVTGIDGRLDQRQCELLRDFVIRDGLIDTPNEFQLLLQILEEAKAGPSDLCTLVLDHICHKIYQLRNMTEDSDQAALSDIATVWIKRVGAVAGKFCKHEEKRAQALLEMHCEGVSTRGNSDFVAQAQKQFVAA